MEAINQIKVLNDAAIVLSTLRPRFLEKIKDTSCDKHDMKFGGDERFAVFNAKVFLDCHTGYYGNSSCSRLGGVDNVVAQRLLNKALNSLMPEILNKMAEAARNEANALTEKAQKEIDALQSQIDKVKTPIE